MPLKDSLSHIECGRIAAAIILPNIGGYINGRITRDQLKPWYESIRKPSFNPPNWVFAPVWTSLYTGIGYASYLVWRDGGVNVEAEGARMCALALYGTQLALNMAWSPLFFKYHSFKWVILPFAYIISLLMQYINDVYNFDLCARISQSLVDIVLLTSTAGACGLAFYQINRTAGLLFVPYVAWLSFASLLNYSMWKLNKNEITSTEMTDGKDK